MLDTDFASAGIATRQAPFNLRQVERINRSVLKRTVDIAGAAFGLLVLAPLVLIPVAIAIKLDSPGPVIYRQWRNGRGGRFQIVKFRSMTSAASREEFRQATQADARVTRVGRLLRKFNIDELPQLWNVLVGDMSLVGPRPHPVPLDDSFAATVPNLPLRYLVRPGITGWAQVNGLRGETEGVAPMAARVRHDLDYITKWSVLLDLEIIVRTVLFRKAYTNAY